MIIERDASPQVLDSDLPESGSFVPVRTHNFVLSLELALHDLVFAQTAKASLNLFSLGEPLHS